MLAPSSAPWLQETVRATQRTPRASEEAIRDAGARLALAADEVEPLRAELQRYADGSAEAEVVLVAARGLRQRRADDGGVLRVDAAARVVFPGAAGVLARFPWAKLA